MPGTTTDQRLIAAAERLFAEQGVGAVSLRAVMQAAQTNVASVHYYFGSKQALLDAVLRSRLDQVSAERESLLAQLSGADVTARDLANALVRPVVAVLDSGGQFWIRLVGQMLAAGDDRLISVAESFFERNAMLVELLERLSPGVAVSTLHFRLTEAMSLTLNVLGDVGRTQWLLSSGAHMWSTDEVLTNLVDVVTSVLAGPPDHVEKRN